MGTGTVDQLHEAIDALAAVDVDTLPDGALDELTIQRATRTAPTRRGRRHVAGPLGPAGRWRSDGSRSAAARLARDTSTSLPRARPRACAAPTASRTCRCWPRRSPLAGCRWTTSTCSPTPTPPPATSAFVRDEAMLVEHCQLLRFAQAVHAIGYWKLRVDATGTVTTTRSRLPTRRRFMPRRCWTASFVSTATSTRSAAPRSSPNWIA